MAIRRRASVALLLTGCAVSGCGAAPPPMGGLDDHAPSAEPPPPIPQAAEAPPRGAVSAIRPLDSDEIIALVVPGHGDAVVYVPVGATERRPVLVATHGAGGTPEDACAYWRLVSRDRGFVLCPRGRATSIYDPPDQRGYYYPDHFALIREVDAAFAALSARFPDYVDEGSAVYAGFSQGAIMGALLIHREAARFPKAALVEGGFAEWNIPVARRYRETGGARVLFGCGNPGCAAQANDAVHHLQRAGVGARLAVDLRAGHSLGATLGGQVARGFEWLVEGDARWTPPSSGNIDAEQSR